MKTDKRTISAEKQAIAREYRDRLSGVDSVVMTEIKGFSSQSFTRLRVRLAAGEADYWVVSNRLFRRVLEGTPFAPLSAGVAGGSAVAVGRRGLPDLARQLIEFEKEEGKAFLRTGMWEGTVFEASGLKRLARLPSRQELLAQVATGIQGPISSFVSVLGRLLPAFLSVLQQASQKMGENKG
jgi:large subunit ribosomal protein L10